MPTTPNCGGRLRKTHFALTPEKNNHPLKRRHRKTIRLTQRGSGDLFIGGRQITASLGGRQAGGGEVVERGVPSAVSVGGASPGG